MNDQPAWMTDEYDKRYGSEEHEGILLARVKKPYDPAGIPADKQSAVTEREALLFSDLFSNKMFITGDIGKLSAWMHGGGKKRDEAEEKDNLDGLALMQKELAEAYVQAGIAAGGEAGKVLVQEFTRSCQEVIDQAFPKGKARSK